ncbi:MAG: hypothetical protein LBJ01_03490 [Tannerella sp.]|jgi:predicted HTH transcriptional regulator|nr:hypothetical protein [Tannerella sp.]
MLKLPLPDNRKGILDSMLQGKIIVRHENEYDVKNIGALLFAKHLEDFERTGRKAIRVIFYDGNNRIKTIREQTGEKGYAVGFEGLIKYLEDNLPSNEVIDMYSHTRNVEASNNIFNHSKRYRADFSPRQTKEGEVHFKLSCFERQNAIHNPSVR